MWQNHTNMYFGFKSKIGKIEFFPQVFSKVGLCTSLRLCFFLEFIRLGFEYFWWPFFFLKSLS